MGKFKKHSGQTGKGFYFTLLKFDPRNTIDNSKIVWTYYIDKYEDLIKDAEKINTTLKDLVDTLNPIQLDIQKTLNFGPYNG